MIFHKKQLFFKTMRSVIVFYIFANIFHISLEVNSFIIFYKQSVTIWYFNWSIWRKSSLTQICSLKKKKYLYSLFRKV